MNSDLILKWGIVSTGLISADFCTALLSLKSDKHILQAVAARNIDDAKHFANRFNIPSFYDSYDKLNEDPEINIVYVGAINSAHKDISVRALNAKKHVLCEKPMTLSLKEQDEVLNASKINNRFFMEAIWTRFFPSVLKLKQELDNKTIGDVKVYNGNFTVPIKDKDRLKNKSLGGGAIFDIGIYPIQLACLVFNHEKPVKISVSGHLMSTGVDEAASITLLYSDQRFATINVSTNCAMHGPTFIAGEKGIIQIPNFSWCPTEIIMNNESLKFPLPECDKTNFENSVGLRFQAEACYEAISKGLIECPKMTHDNSRLIMSIIEESRRQLGYTLPEEN